MRQIEWTGHPSIFGSAKVQRDRMLGRISNVQLEVLRRAAGDRVYRIPGRSARVIKPDDPNLVGLSKEYQWGPGAEAFVQDMTDEDWQILHHFETVVLRAYCTSVNRPYNGTEFRDVSDGVPLIEPPAQDIVEVRKEQYNSVRDFLRAASGQPLQLRR